MERLLKSNRRQRFLPTVGLGAELEHVFSRDGAGSDPVGPTGEPIDVEDTQWYVGLNLSLPFFKGGEIKLESEQTEIEIKRLQKQRVYLIQNIELSVEANVRDLALSVANLDLSKKSAELALKSYEMVQDAYSKGAVSIVELTDAQTYMLNAELIASNSEYDFYDSLLNVQRAISVFFVSKTIDQIEAFSQSFQKYLTEQN
jgi:outer membrane protein TolC